MSALLVVPMRAKQARWRIPSFMPMMKQSSFSDLELASKKKLTLPIVFQPG
ncbi:hypothetical protein ACFPQ5_09415 [Massilia suwonensis]|uniref:Uncharacterized protein n=1 Tax=Massilia suwonensis TaxID=648895 RepID=A0ABW0MLE9_9BURK